MESPQFEIDLLTDHEPGIPGGGTPPSMAGGTPAATETSHSPTPTYFNSRRYVLDGMFRDDGSMNR